MKKLNGKSGSLTPDNDTRSSHLDETWLIVSQVKQTAQSQPTSWDGQTAEGHKVHIGYLFGVISIEVQIPVPEIPGFGRWQTIVRYKPSLIAAELEGRSPEERQMFRMMAERAMISEIRRSNEADMRDQVKTRAGVPVSHVLLNKDRLVIGNRQLIEWLEIRNQNLPRLMQLGLAGGASRVSVRFR